MTKKNQSLLNNYTNATTRTLEQLYENASIYKYRAYNHCVECMEKLSGFDFRCFGANCFSFSCAFQYVDKDNGNIKLMYFTKDNTYCFDI